VENKRDGTGLLYRRNRYLDPVSGRFTQPDPIGLGGGLNSYGFAGGDPVNFSDPFGLMICPPRCGPADGDKFSGGGGGSAWGGKERATTSESSPNGLSITVVGGQTESRLQSYRISDQKQNRHVHGTREYNRELASRERPPSYFADRESADKYVKYTWENGAPVRGDPNVRKMNFGHVVGVGESGGYQSSVTVVRGKTGLHGYPSGPEH
jgi:RHS repeat-associated protein